MAKVDPEPVLTLDEAAALTDHRRTQAVQHEVNAASFEVAHRQWTKLAGVEGIVDAPQQIVSAKKQAVEAGKVAAAMHKLAGTTRAIAKDNVLHALRYQRLNYERAYIGARDAAEHPDAYPPQINSGPEVWAAAIEATDELIAEVEKW